MKTIMDKTMAFGIGSVVGLLICSMLLKDHRYFELIATWLIDMSRELLPSIHAGIFMLMSAGIFASGIWFGKVVK